MTEFQIDKHRLDEEWEKHVPTFRKHARRLAKREYVLDNAEATLKVVRADVELAVRRRPDKYGLETSTEAAIKAAVERHSKVKAAAKAVNDARYAVNICKADVRTLEHKKTGLEEELKMHLAGYFAEPRADGDAGRAMRERKGERAFGKRRGGKT